ncbi:hypothetical protein PO909_013071 [Leuciscus waleckii]
MRIPVKLFGFVFWLFSLNCAQCQECLQKDITYENIEPDAKASYSDGETVRVKCMTGYTGLYKLNCENGKWKTVVERPCAKKKCSQPGDIANGDFKLIKGSEFVFGATVLYTCKKGFEMTSRINQRTCRSEGWDNTLPVCEAVKCPAIRTDGGVTASGNTDEGSYGDLIHFECVSTDKKIDGSSDIHCTETGEWSDSVPTCKEITCAAPVIQDGYVVEEMQKYQKDARLKYECFKGFKPREGIPKCSKFGWTLKPECDEKMCAAPNIANAKIVGEQRPKYKISSKIQYKCNPGFEPEQPVQITCNSQTEWTGILQCTEKCGLPPKVDFADTTKMTKNEYNSGEKVEYSCFYKYTLDQHHPYSKYLTCEQGQWRGNIRCLKPCSVTVEEMDKRGIRLRWGKQENKISTHEDQIGFECQTGKNVKGNVNDLRQTCNDGVMNLPQCV